ncbi:tRNA synthetases class II (A) [Aliiroseovarius crassostreae]|nr:tRNA synthetases class II (A) [Aliiroseovarius crassostreae]
MQDAYLREAMARVVAHTDQGGLVLDRCLFYPTGGGQTGDAGYLRWGGEQVAIATAVKSPEGPVLVPEAG